MAGKNLADVARMRGLEPTIENGAEAGMWVVEQGICQAVYHAMSEADLERVMRHPATMIASDGWVQILGRGVPHPRSYGTFVRVLGVYVRERNVITLEDAIRKMTSFPAQRLRVGDRGVLRSGMKADITVFDPARVRDMATFEKPHQYAEGISSVIVNGQVVFDGKAMTRPPWKGASQELNRRVELLISLFKSRRAYEKAASGVCVCRGARRGAPPCVSRKPDERPTDRRAIPIDNDDLGGTVTGPKGPEAGVWVIAETADLGTKFVKIVVTDDRGRYLLPDLPKASYSVWVRGYGLVDSPKTQTVAGKIINLKAVPAPNPRAAAEYYPAGYWLSLMKVPDKSEFPGTGDMGNGIATTMLSQAQWRRQMSVRRVHGLSCDRQRGDARHSERARLVSEFDCGLGSPCAIGPGRRRHEQRPERVRPAARARDVRRLDRSDREGRSAPRRRRGRRASSATSSSPSGIGPIRSHISTTRSQPIGAIRA